MTEPFDAVLAEMRAATNSAFATPQYRLADWTDRLSAAHAAEVAERDARIAELDSECRQHLLRALENGQAALAAEARAEAAERDARRYRWLRDRIAPEELTDTVVAIFALHTAGPIAARTADDDCLDDVDAVIDAAIATTEGAP